MASNYRKRYRYNGSFFFSYQNTKNGDKGMLAGEPAEGGGNPLAVPKPDQKAKGRERFLKLNALRAHRGFSPAVYFSSKVF